MVEVNRPSTALFDVFLRLRPSSAVTERFLDVERSGNDDNGQGQEATPTHITIKPPSSDHRKRAIERFAFTRVFEEHVGQREVLESTGALALLEGVLGPTGREGRDGLLATLGVTGSGKSHTILGSKLQRGLTQLTLDVLFACTRQHLVDVETNPTVYPSLCAADLSEAHILPAANFLESVYSDAAPSRGATPALDTSYLTAPPSRRYMPRLSTLPSHPPVEDVVIQVDANAEYAIVVSMYEVYNDRIFDLLTASASGRSPQKRRALLFKSTENSPDRKVVAGLRKVICTTLEDALLVLETGLHERRVAGTGSNAVSSRSHGFFCLEVKKRRRGPLPGPWTSSAMTIVDLAGSERARTAKTAGATLAEAGKINESLMYLGQCMQMQSDNGHATTPNLVPFRQCKLTELLFSNSFTRDNVNHKRPQKAIMIVAADPLGDFNATSQILRYSALAREVTVPRIPSVTSTILSGTTGAAGPGGSGYASGRSTPAHEELESALAALSHLREQLEVTQILLEEETERRQQAENSWRVAEAKLEDIEGEVREEVWSEMESRLAQEQRRWRAARDEELEARDEHLDRKLDILAQGITIYEDETADKENRIDGETAAVVEKTSTVDESAVAELQDENAMLRERLANLEREKDVLRSPSKKIKVLKTRKWNGSGMGLDDIP